MPSYLDLVEQAVMLQEMRAGQRNRNLSVNTPNVSFNDIFSQSLKQIEKTGAPTSQGVAGIDLSLPADDAEKFKKSLAFVLEKEGSKLVHEDGASGESSKYGILQSTARAFGYKGNMKDMTRDAAEKIYKKLWELSGSRSLSFPLAIVHFDTYVNSPGMAKKLLERSKGNIDTYLKLREQRYVKLASAKPDVYGKYLQGWKNRIKGLRAVATQYAKANNFTSDLIYPSKKG